MKSKEFGRPGGGRASLTPPLDPPMYAYYIFQLFCLYTLRILSRNPIAYIFEWIWHNSQRAVRIHVPYSGHSKGKSTNTSSEYEYMYERKIHTRNHLN